MTDERMREVLKEAERRMFPEGIPQLIDRAVLGLFASVAVEIALSPPARRTSYEWPDHTWGEGRLVYRVVWSGDRWQIQWRRPFTGEDWRNRNPAHEVSDSGIAAAIATLAGLEKEEES